MAVSLEYVIEIEADLARGKGVFLWLLWLGFRRFLFVSSVGCNSVEI